MIPPALQSDRMTCPHLCIDGSGHCNHCGEYLPDFLANGSSAEELVQAEASRTAWDLRHAAELRFHSQPLRQHTATAPPTQHYGWPFLCCALLSATCLASGESGAASFFLMLLLLLRLKNLYPFWFIRS